VAQGLSLCINLNKMAGHSFKLIVAEKYLLHDSDDAEIITQEIHVTMVYLTDDE
jgi:hypothetical protein